MKSTKWIKHYMSKYKYPTRVLGGGTGVIIGHKAALRDLEVKLKRPLHKDTKIVTRGWNWVFMEPKQTKTEGA